MSQQQLDWATGLYKYDNDNHFVISDKEGSLYLKVDDKTVEKLSAGGDGLYSVENTNIKVKFHRTDNSAASSITVYFPDRQVVASRKILISKDQSYFSKVKELGIFISIFVVLAAISPLLYNPIKKSCLSHGSKLSCQIANMMAPVFSTKKEIDAIGNELSKYSYSQTRADVVQACESGEQNSCIEVAKQKFQIGAKDKAYEILNRGCFEFKHGGSCQQMYNFLIQESNISE